MPILGAFHIFCCFLAVMGKRFGDAGLTDLLIESEVIGSGSISAVIEGRQYSKIKTLIKTCLWVSSATSRMTCQM